MADLKGDLRQAADLIERKRAAGMITPEQANHDLASIEQTLIMLEYNEARKEKEQAAS